MSETCNGQQPTAAWTGQSTADSDLASPLRRAVVQAAWTKSAFGLRAECYRILRAWVKRGVPEDVHALILYNHRHPNPLRPPKWYAA